MFTKNAKIFLSKNLGGVGSCHKQGIVTYKGETFTDGSDIINMGNVALATTAKAVKKTGLTYSSSSVSNGVYFGTGNAAPTADDYSFSGEAVTGFTSSYVQSVSYNSDGSPTISTVYTITAPTSGDITIGEVCMFIDVSGKTPSYPSTSMNCPVLIDRTALETPITIPAGGVGQITYAITINPPI